MKALREKRNVENSSRTNINEVFNFLRDYVTNGTDARNFHLPEEFFPENDRDAVQKGPRRYLGLNTPKGHVINKRYKPLRDIKKKQKKIRDFIIRFLRHNTKNLKKIKKFKVVRV